MKSLTLGLRGQLVLLIMVALVVAQAASVWFLVDERGQAIRAAQGRETADRAANVVRLIENGPTSLHEEILNAATSSLVRFTISDRPNVDHTDHGLGGIIETRIRGTLDGVDDRGILVEIHDIQPPTEMFDVGDTSMAAMHREMMRGSISAIEMQLAIELNDGRWLNVGTRFHRPPIQWTWASVMSFGITAATLVGVALWFGLSRVTGPLRNLARAAERFGHGDEPVALVPEGPAEVRELSSALLRMQDRIGRFVSERMRLLAALGHDLRSPLTALRVEAELVDDGDTRNRLITSIEEMQGMVETTLSYAKGIAGTEELETVDLATYLQSLVNDMHAAVPINSPEDVHLNVRTVSLRRALRNLIENAQRYGGTPEVEASVGSDRIVVDIKDRGPGIADEDLERVFDPYVRLEESRSRDTGGIGLGLSIARTIIRAHGGELRLIKREGGGLIARVELPDGQDESA